MGKKKGSQKNKQPEEELADDAEKTIVAVEEFLPESETTEDREDKGKEETTKISNADANSQDVTQSTPEYSPCIGVHHIPIQMQPITPPHHTVSLLDDELEALDSETPEIESEPKYALTCNTNNLPAVIGDGDSSSLDIAEPTSEHVYNANFMPSSSYMIPVSPKPKDYHTQEDDKTLKRDPAADLDNIPLPEGDYHAHCSFPLSRQESRNIMDCAKDIIDFQGTELESTEAYKTIYYTWLSLHLGYLMISRNHSLY